MGPQAPTAGTLGEEPVSHQCHRQAPARGSDPLQTLPCHRYCPRHARGQGPAECRGSSPPCPLPSLDGPSPGDQEQPNLQPMRPRALLPAGHRPRPQPFLIQERHGVGTGHLRHGWVQRALERKAGVTGSPWRLPGAARCPPARVRLLLMHTADRGHPKALPGASTGTASRSLLMPGFRHLRSHLLRSHLLCP